MQGALGRFLRRPQEPTCSNSVQLAGGAGVGGFVILKRSQFGARFCKVLSARFGCHPGRAHLPWFLESVPHVQLKRASPWRMGSALLVSHLPAGGKTHTIKAPV